jgi:penicillin-binding protein 1A
MDTFLVKIFATALTLSQVTTTPENVHTVFDRVADQANVVSLLRDGCSRLG